MVATCRKCNDVKAKLSRLRASKDHMELEFREKIQSMRHETDSLK
jgi:hypothetical protein